MAVEYNNAQHWNFIIESMTTNEYITGTMPVGYEGTQPILAGFQMKVKSDMIEDEELSKVIQNATKELLRTRRFSDEAKKAGAFIEMIHGLTRYPWLIRVEPKSKSQLKRIKASL